jgi:hypothetical protein
LSKEDDVWLLTMSLLCGLPVLAALVVPWLLYARPAIPVVETPWRVPTAVAVIGGAITVILAFLPIVVGIPGDHESAACGNAFGVTVRERDLTDIETGRSTYDDCVLTSRTRRVGAITALTGTTLIVTFLVLRTRRRAPAGGVGERTNDTPAT